MLGSFQRISARYDDLARATKNSVASRNERTCEMARNDIEVKKVPTIFEELDRLHQDISRRAYDLFRNSGTAWGGALADWLNAERELIWKPAAELRQTDREFEVRMALSGVDPKDLDVQITPEDLLIKSEGEHEHKPEAGTVHLCEFASGRIFRSIHFPETVDPESAKAEYKNGMLRVTAAIAKAATAKKIEIKAA